MKYNSGITSLVLVFLGLGILSANAQAQDASNDQQIGIRFGASLPNGGELGADYQFNEHLRAGGSYGYLHYADAANLQVQGGFKHFYGFAGIDMINANNAGRTAIADAINQQVTNANQSGFNGIRFKESDFRMTDLGIGGGLGVKFGIFYLEAGLRTTRLRQIANDKVDMFVNTVENYVNSNLNLSASDRAAAIQKVESMRNDVKSQLLQQYNNIPGGLNVLPVLRIGIRIPIGLY